MQPFRHTPTHCLPGRSNHPGAPLTTTGVRTLIREQVVSRDSDN